MKRATSATLLVLALASFAVTGCSKDKKDEADAAADATAAVVTAVADAAPEAAAVAEVDAAVDAAVAPLATVAKPIVKPKADPTICFSARAAKQKKSPAAANLEKQCIAAGGVM